MNAKWTNDDVPGQQGRLAVVTGANTGLGLETAQVLAAGGASGHGPEFTLDLCMTSSLLSS